MRGKKLIKKIIALAFIITLLQNYFLILSDSAATFASEIVLETKGKPKLDVNSNIINEENSEENIEVNSEESSEESSEVNNEVISEMIGEENVEVAAEEISEENNELNLVEDNINADEEIVADEIQIPEDETITIDNDISETDSNTNQEKEIFDNAVSIDCSVLNSLYYKNSTSEGTAIESDININITDEHVQEVELQLNVPKISEKTPYNVLIINNEDLEYNYDNINGIISVKISKKYNNDNIFLNKNNNEINNEIENGISEVYTNIQSSFKIISIYDLNSYENLKIEIAGIVKAKINDKDLEKEILLEKNIGNIIESKSDFNVTSDNTSMYKGYLYSNLYSENKINIKYNTVDQINLTNTDVVNKFVISEEVDKICSDVEKSLDEINFYTKTEIDANKFNEILGNKGFIEVYNGKTGVLLGIINKNSNIENQKYVFNYLTNVSSVEFRIINPEKDGLLEIKNEKLINGDNNFTRDEVVNFNKIVTTVNSKALKLYKESDELVLQEKVSLNEIKLEKTESKMELELSNWDLSTELDNEVTINVKLKTDSEQYELYKNPSIQIEFPPSVKDVEIKGINLLYKNNLALNTWEVVDNEIGGKTIKIKLDGLQDKYAPGKIIEGTNINIDTLIKIDKLTPSGQGNVKFRYSNESGTTTSYQEAGKDCEEYTVNYVNREGLIKEIKLENFNDSLEVIDKFNIDDVVGEANINSEKRVTTVSGKILNNFSKDIENVIIIGNIPKQGSINIDDNIINSNFDTSLQGELKTTGLITKIYYSENSNETIDSGNWKENIEDYSQVKSYKIEIENETMHKGERLDFSYDILIPENMTYNQESYGVYTVYYTYEGQELHETSTVGIVTEKRDISIEDCSKVEEANNLKIGSYITKGGALVNENEEIFERQALKYTIVIQNISNETLTNVNIKGKAHNSNLYYFKETKSIEIDDTNTYVKYAEDDGTKQYEEKVINKLDPNEKIYFEYQVIVKNLEECIEDQEVYGEVLISADNLEETKFETSKNTIKEAKISLRTELEKLELPNSYNIYAGNFISFDIFVKNLSNEEINNLEVNVLLDDMLIYYVDGTYFYNNKEEFKIDYLKNDLENKVKINVYNLKANEEKKVKLEVLVKDSNVNEEIFDFKVKATSEYLNEQYVSNEYISKICQKKENLSYTFEASLKEEGVKDGDIITYILHLKNTGSADTGNIYIKDYYPSALIPKNTYLTKAGTKEKLDINNTHNIIVSTSLNPQEEIILEIEMQVSKYMYQENQEIIENVLELDGLKLSETIRTNVITYKVLDYKDNVDDENNNDDRIKDKEVFIDEKDDEFTKDTNNKPIDNDDLIINNYEKEIENNNDIIINNEENKKEVVVNEIVENKFLAENRNNPTISNENGSVLNVIEKKDESIPKYTIKGKLWNDKNRNGIYENEEQMISNINVLLYRTTSNNNQNKELTELVSTTTTNKNGYYSFENLLEGNYIVLFEYDSNNYITTIYKSEKAKESEKSSVISQTVEVNGERKIVALSDIINLNKNYNEVNAGIYEKDRFDFSLNKYIESIKVENKKGIEQNSYNDNNQDLVKVEVASKYLLGTKVTINYIIEVINEGDIEGYVGKVVDYLPQGLDFDENINKDWHLDNNGNLYNYKLINTAISPERSVKLNLTLTKTLTENNTGIFENSAEIVEITNNREKEDFDSTPNNKIVEEDDYSSVKLLITVKTGGIIYISLIMIIGVIVLISIGIKINKKGKYIK